MVERATDADRARRQRATSRRSRRPGATVYRGEGRITGRGMVTVSHDDQAHELTAKHVVLAVGSESKPVKIPGMDAVKPWTNVEATLTRELPRSLLVLGGGPTGCELAQVYARFGVPTTIVQSGPRLAPTDHPRNSDVIRKTLEADGVTVRTGVRAVAARAGAGHGRRARDRARRRVDGRGPRRSSRPSGARCRSTTWGWSTTAWTRPGGRRPTRATAGCGWRTGCGPRAMPPDRSCTRTRPTTRARSRSGWPSASTVAPDYRALPRATYTDPEAAFVGVTVEAAREAGTRRVRARGRLREEHPRLRARGRSSGHVTIVVDRATRELVGAAIACPDASAAIHECVLAIQAHVPVDTLADGDPRVPVDVADLQRPVRGRAARARRARERRHG